METITSEYASMSDAQLLRLVASGKSEALEALYDRYVKQCYGVSLRIVADRYVAEEVVQDIYLKLWAAPLSYAPEQGKFSTWLLTLVRNRSIDYLRRGTRTIPAGSMAFDTADASNAIPYDTIWRGERSRVVHRALSLLSAPLREVISLAYFGGLTQREISRRSGVPLGTIKTRTQRGLKQLRKLLAGESLVEDVA